MAKSKKYVSRLNQEVYSFVLKNNIKIYPIYIDEFWYVEVNVFGSKKTFNKKIGKGKSLTSKEPYYGDVNWIEAIDKTYLYYYDKLMKPKKDKL